MATGVGFIGFLTWDDVLEWVRAGNRVYYQAPLDVRPWLIMAKAAKGTRKTIRVTPPMKDTDPFTADNGHLDRFKRRQ